jgi:hypothetical protein
VATLSRRRRSAADIDSLPSELIVGVIPGTQLESKAQMQALPEKLERY